MVEKRFWRTVVGDTTAWSEEKMMGNKKKKRKKPELPKPLTFYNNSRGLDARLEQQQLCSAAVAVVSMMMMMTTIDGALVVRVGNGLVLCYNNIHICISYRVIVR